MGLRVKIISALLSILLGLAITGSMVRQRELERSYLERERAEAIGDLRRLLVSLESRFLELDAILRSWSNWTALYDHAQTRDYKFAREDLSFDSLRNSSIDWLALVNDQGKITELVEVPETGGEAPVTETMSSGDSALNFAAAISRRAGIHGCGIVQPTDRISFVCFRPLYNSDGRGPAHGMLAIGNWIEESVLQTVRKQSKLDFVVTVFPRASMPPAEIRLIDSPFGDGSPAIEEFPEHLKVRFPITTVIGQPVGEITMIWPRTSRMEALEAMREGQMVLILAIMVTGALMIFIIDRLVVNRLQRLHQELAAISENGRWGEQVTSTGHDEIAALARFINEHLSLIRSQLEKLHDLSMTDTLTGLPNRRRFDEQLERALGQHQRTGRGVALALFDVDFFKKYNDTYGHPAGDVALARVAQCLRQSAQRPGDLPARIGGEEFAIIFDDTDLQGARDCAENARKFVIQAALPHSASTVAAVMTVSCGVAFVRPSDTPGSLYSRADAALYIAKENGRNRVAVEAPQGSS